MTLTADEFIRRFLLHVLPDGFKRIRSYGWLANCHRADKLAQCRQLLQMEPKTPCDTGTEPSDYRDRYQELTRISLHQCPVCHRGRMLIVEHIDRPAQPRSPWRHHEVHSLWPINPAKLGSRCSEGPGCPTPCTRPDLILIPLSAVPKRALHPNGTPPTSCNNPSTRQLIIAEVQAAGIKPHSVELVGGLVKSIFSSASPVNSRHRRPICGDAKLKRSALCTVNDYAQL